jgi:hypothetical protein
MAFTYGVGADYYHYGLIVGFSGWVGSPRPANTPSILADNDVDWMLNDVAWSVSTGGTTDAEREITVDNRSRRTIREAEDRYILAIGNGSAAGQTYRFHTRTLLALP